MTHDNSYESGRLAFRPILTRGHWAKSNDFIHICLGLAFKLDFSVIPMIYFMRLGIVAFIPYLFCIALYVVPIMILHSYMGQFSSSGFISAFRISPLFKGLGYISLAMNLVLLMYYSIFATVPLIFIFNSFRPTLPWSCDALEQNIIKGEINKMCHVTKAENVTFDVIVSTGIPSIIYFESVADSLSFYPEFSFSWVLFGCTVVVWSLIAGVLYKFNNAAAMGKFLRYAIWGTLVALFVCIARFVFLPGAIFSSFFFIDTKVPGLGESFQSILMYTMFAFGSAWGSIISLSSFNKFNRNIVRDSWIISVGQMFIFVAFNCVAILIASHFRETYGETFWDYIYDHWLLYVSAASAIADMRFANMWTIIFYGMLLAASLIVMITQLYSVLVTIFDEFESLRKSRARVTFGLIGVLSLCSVFLCTIHGRLSFSSISLDMLFSQTSLNLLLILVVLWMYGRERFQRDIEFMLGRPFATWKINLLRFVVPVCLVAILICSILIAVEEHSFATEIFVDCLAIICIVLPWLALPGYGIFILCHATGSCSIKRACQPTDWHPVELADRQRYESAMQLNQFGEEVL